MSECRWSGWPGAWCLDCGREDPREVAAADGHVDYDCDRPKEHCVCPNADVWLKCPHFGAIYHTPIGSLDCAEPNSNRCNPYVSVRGDLS